MNYVNQQEAANILKTSVHNFMEMVKNNFISGYEMHKNYFVFPEEEIRAMRRRMVMGEI